MFPSALFFTALATIQASPSPTMASAQEPVGTWTYVSDSGLEQAIRDSTEGMFAPMRPVARGRLKTHHAPRKTIKISRAQDVVSVQFDEEPILQLPINGQETAVTGKDGEKATASLRIQKDQWVQAVRGKEGEQIYTFQLDGPGKLQVQVMAKNPRLTKPLTYTIFYRRNG